VNSGIPVGFRMSRESAMFDHATLPKLPPRLWQAAFFIDMVDQNSHYLFSDEAMAMSDRMSRLAEEVIDWRKKKLGW
jgi:hypothetical protein